MRTSIAGAALALLLGACAAAPASPPTTDAETSEQASVTRSALEASGKAARSYGRAHLGHFLNLSAKALRREGLELPESITLSIKTTHTAFCIVATNDSLPSIHPWARASLSSREPRPSEAGRCRL